MITIQYKVLRYQPDKISGEFVNLGIIAFDSSNGYLKSKFINKIGKISGFFSKTNSRYLLKVVKMIQDDFDVYAGRLKSEIKFKEISQIDEIVNNILPKDDSALLLSETKKSLDINLDSAVEDLFSRFVKTNLGDEEDDEVRNDKEVWSRIYKKHFDEYGISSHLSSHKVKTKNDELEFEKAWKNGVWNCFESVSFNLTRTDTIKNKVYKWAGKLDELSSTKEVIHIYLLSLFPHDHPELNNFIKHKINEKSTESLKVELVSESNIEKVVKKIKKELDRHSQE
jgi:hypothetical protein